MKKSFASILVVLVASTLSLAAVPPPSPPPTQPAPPPPRGGRGGGRGGPPANLGGAMRDMNAMLTAVKAESADPAKLEQTLKDIATMQRDAAISKTLTPPTINALTGNKKIKAAEDYRVIMVSLMKTLLDLEDAVVAKKPDDITKLLKQLEDIETKGHTEFIKKANTPLFQCP